MTLSGSADVTVRPDTGRRCATARPGRWRRWPRPRARRARLRRREGRAAPRRGVAGEVGEGPPGARPAGSSLPRPAPRGQHPHGRHRRQHPGADAPDGPRVAGRGPALPARHPRPRRRHRRRAGSPCRPPGCDGHTPARRRRGRPGRMAPAISLWPACGPWPNPAAGARGWSDQEPRLSKPFVERGRRESNPRSQLGKLVRGGFETC